jgi:type VI secretion system protein VasG
MRRRQNNPILTGEAGVGKTAVVEGFAQRIARGDVPPPLKDVSAAARSTSACCRPAPA